MCWWYVLIYCTFYTNTYIDMRFFVIRSSYFLVLLDMQCMMIRSMVANISSFLSKGHDTVWQNICTYLFFCWQSVLSVFTSYMLSFDTSWRFQFKLWVTPALPEVMHALPIYFFGWRGSPMISICIMHYSLLNVNATVKKIKKYLVYIHHAPSICIIDPSKGNAL